MKGMVIKQQPWKSLNPRTFSRSCHASNILAPEQSPELKAERGVQFMQGAAFYRPESSQGRDLAILAAALYRKRTGSLRVLDVMAGSGIRGARYLQQARADEVWCNDYNPGNQKALIYNMLSSSSIDTSDLSSIGDVLGRWADEAQEVQPPGLKKPVWRWRSNHTSPEQLGRHISIEKTSKIQLCPSETTDCNPAVGALHQDSVNCLESSTGAHYIQLNEQMEDLNHGSAGPCHQDYLRHKILTVSHLDAFRLLSCCALNEDYYDMVDIDSFGSDTSFLGAAMDCVKYGGLLYLTSTDGFCSGGHRPERSLAAYGAYLRAMPFSNEQGLRMLIGAAVKEGASRGLAVIPVFSLYSYHGPVFRVMLRATRSAEWPHHHYGFVGHCHVHGDTRHVAWRDISSARCMCCEPGRKVSRGNGLPGCTSESLCHDTRLDLHGAPTLPPISAQESSQNCASGNVEFMADEGENSTDNTKRVMTTPCQTSGRHAPALVLSGPMWTGPLHDREEVVAMQQEAESRGWLNPCSTAETDPTDFQLAGQVGVNRTKRHKNTSLAELLEIMKDEADGALPPGYLAMDTIGKQLVSNPSRARVMEALKAHGFVATRSHLEPKSIRTNARMQDILKVCKESLGIGVRQNSEFYEICQ
ncbi:hypothetical protein CEUSTIGMA_g3046.t1 [Chlamydomonas eustigma]|uniref:tRNA (guanine(26)-N(2))-dimethyltransferase n=1 Tax=Chlamydomonas eustigma TaxID=1157962 RepID=A0A250WYC1_9CHLO|nr:hypothetical protein CEUSTIGMA_g3046.t1 [Chlamydomonas eustigma]|eukprot:GAX75602.1 hypothetical protein CEUSTIGMA_g3046.t1 [Chlamydomonas eustigma]